EPLARQLDGQSLSVPAEDGVQRVAGDVLHDDPVIAARIGAQVEQPDEVRLLQVEALRHAAQLDLLVVAQQLHRDLLAAIADGKVDLAEAAPADATLERVTIKRTLSRAVGESHTTLRAGW